MGNREEVIEVRRDVRLAAACGPYDGYEDELLRRGLYRRAREDASCAQ